MKIAAIIALTVGAGLVAFVGAALTMILGLA